MTASRTIRVLWAIGSISLFLCGQATIPETFEVASVRRTDPNYRYLDFRIAPGGRLTVTNWPLSILIQRSYGLKRYQIQGGPAWMDSDAYDIAAKANGNPTEREMLGMLRALLADRFHLRVQQETRTVEGYALVIAKGGPKLTAAKGAEREWVRRMTRPTECYLEGENGSIAVLAERLGEVLERPVQDRSGITGRYDFLLKFAPPGKETAAADAAPSIFAAMQEQLGLKLEKAPASMEVLTVLQAEKPSGN